MPYSYHKRTNRKRKLTKSSILANRSARSQSKQIAKLNAKVNYLTKQNRPEILTRWVSLNRTFTNASLASNYEVYFWNPWSDIYSGTADVAVLAGNFCRTVGVNVKFNVEYSDNWSGNIAQSENHQRTASYRVVIAQLKESLGSALSASDVFNKMFHASSTLSSSDDNTIVPLKSGVKSFFKILYAKSFGISNQHPIRLHNIRLKRRLVNFTAEYSGGLVNKNYTKGTVIVAILTGGLHSDADYNSQIIFNTCVKIVFTDN